MPALTEANLLDHLRRLTAEGGDDNRLVVASREHYIVVHGRRGAPELLVEAVGNFYLPTAAALTPGREAVLGQRRFTPRPGRNNFYRAAAPADDAELRALVADVLDVFARAYGAEAGEPAEFELQLGDVEPTRNPDLIRRMRLLSQIRDWEARKALYTALLDSTLLVPVDPDGVRVDEPLEVEKLGAFPVIAGFTDIDSLRLWRPRGAPYRAMPVAELVPRAVARRVGSLLINPKGNVGGELYLNELESLDGALKRRASRV